MKTDTAGRTLRVLPIVVDREQKERISIVPVSARAGYMHSYSDPEYIQDLPNFNLPLTELYPDKSYRIFQIEGDSMLPITPGSYVICEYTENWDELKEGLSYMLITKNNGILFKRVWEDIGTDHFLKSTRTSPTRRREASRQWIPKATSPGWRVRCLDRWIGDGLGIVDIRRRSGTGNSNSSRPCPLRAIRCKRQIEQYLSIFKAGHQLGE